jgi:CRISPR system Cascade subunit CasD
VSVLLLRLGAPLQSWGVEGRFNRRTTRGEPSKSGIVGLLASAQGRRRSDPIEDLVGLRLGVRLDQVGRLLRDYHTVSRGDGALPTADGKRRPPKESVITERFYLADAVFVAAVEGPRDLLAALDDALRHPRFPLYLGRRSCVPEGRISLGLRDGKLEDSLAAEPWHASPYQRRRVRQATVRLEVVADDPNGDEMVRDIPVSFDPIDRRYTMRRIRRYEVELPNDEFSHREGRGEDNERAGSSVIHDPFTLLDQ